MRFPGFEGEWKQNTLGELGTFTKGAPLSKADITDDGTPFILYGELYTTYEEVVNEVARKTTRSAAQEHISRVGDVIVPTSGETPEEIATASCIMVSGVILAGDLNIYRTRAVDGRFASYAIRHIINRKIARVAQGKSVVHIKAEELTKININYPSREEQNKILHFLSLLQSRIDRQRKLIDTLKSYKRGLLTAMFGRKTGTAFWDNITWKTVRIGDILEVKHGRDYKDQPDALGTYPVMGTGGQITKIDTFLCDWPCVCIGRKGTINKPMYFDTPFWSVDTLFYTKSRPDNNPKFQYYLFQTIPWTKYNEASGVPSLNSTTIEQIVVEVPEKAGQERISRFFSAFDAIINSADKTLNNLNQIKQGLLQQIFI